MKEPGFTADELSKAGLHQLVAPFPKDGDEQALAESWAAGVVRSYVATSGIYAKVTSIEDDGPIMWLLYELARRGVTTEVRVADQGFWRIATRLVGGFGDRVETLIVRGPTLLLCLAQAMEWWGERVAPSD